MVKFFKLIIICMFPCIQVFSQGYIPFPGSYAKWTNIVSGNDTNSWMLYMYGDTLINNQLYWKMYGSFDEVFNPFNDLCFGGIYEDNNKTIWYRPFDTVFAFDGLAQLFNIGPDLLLYKFGMNIGDTVSCDTNYWMHWKVSSIDSIFIGNAYHKRYFMDIYEHGNISFDKDCWIEGIGSDRELFNIFNYPVEFGDRQLLCFNNTPIPNSVKPDLPFCFYNVGIDKMNKQLEIQIYPNPANEQVKFDLTNTELPATIEIYDIPGNKIFESVINDESFYYHAKGKKGLFYYMIRSQENHIQSGKLLFE